MLMIVNLQLNSTGFWMREMIIQSNISSTKNYEIIRGRHYWFTMMEVSESGLSIKLNETDPRDQSSWTRILKA